MPAVMPGRPIFHLLRPGYNERSALRPGTGRVGEELVAVAAREGEAVGGTAEEPRGAPAAILTADDDLRLMIRGVFALERRSVALEGSGPEFLRLLGATDGPLVLVYDAAGATDVAWEALSGVLRSRPELRPLVLVPSGRPELKAAAIRAGVTVVVERPLVLRELARTLRELADPPTAAAPPA